MRQMGKIAFSYSVTIENGKEHTYLNGREGHWTPNHSRWRTKAERGSFYPIRYLVLRHQNLVSIYTDTRESKPEELSFPTNQHEFTVNATFLLLGVRDQGKSCKTSTTSHLVLGLLFNNKPVYLWDPDQWEQGKAEPTSILKKNKINPWAGLYMTMSNS